MPLIHITEEEIRRHVGFPIVLEAIERAFLAFDGGNSAVFDVVRGTGTNPDHFFAIKSGRDSSIPLIGLKAGSYNPPNLARGMPAHTSTTLLFDDSTGAPIAVVDANYLNGMRTASADAAAVRRLAREDARTLGVVGFGAQAVFEIEAVLHVRRIERVVVAGRSPEQFDKFAEAVKLRTGSEIEMASIEDVTRMSDILVTVTGATAPIIRREWIKAGTHVSAMGADNVGKQELDPLILRDAAVYIDAMPQAAIIGECQHAVAVGFLDRAALAEQTLGGLISGRIAGRTSDEMITVFDSSGIAVQDIAAAYAAMSTVLAARGMPLGSA